jgi:hypothetical protein
VFYIKAEGENKWLFPNSTKVKTIQAKKRKIGRSDLEQFVNVVIFSIMHIKPIRLIDLCLMPTLAVFQLYRGVRSIRNLIVFDHCA